MHRIWLYHCLVMLEVVNKGKALWLGVETRRAHGVLELVFQSKGENNLVLHWATAETQGGSWRPAPPALWPADSQAHGDSAVQSPFQQDVDGGALSIRFPEGSAPAFVVFDLFMPDSNRWENNRGKDFWIALAEPPPSPGAALQQSRSDPAVEVKSISLDGGGQLAVAVERTETAITLTLVTDIAGPVLLHWAVQDRMRSPWKLPPADQRPAGTVAFDALAARTPFEERDRLHWLELEFKADAAPGGIGCVLFQPESGRWCKHRGADLFLPVAPCDTGAAALPALAERIVEGEMGPHGWTLMHRFNLCHELIEDAGDDREAWALLFVWLRYSAIRQLDWQRNYNTKPRELAHAQERLTQRLAQAFIRHPAQRDLIRWMLGSMGRGGEGQRIRDDILHIMHRHHIKEVGGTWMEQWHQKLHNNTTPDDIVICEAYLAFLRADGNLEAYDQTLLAGGVTRERLAGFERPITRNPEWHPHLKEGLLHDFEQYLALLRSVHSGTDLDTAIRTALPLLEGGARQAVEFVQRHFRDEQQPATVLVSSITRARGGLNDLLQREQDHARVKDALYLDLALEEALRTVIERQLQSCFSPDNLHELIGLVLTNLVGDDAELAQCQREWQRLPAEHRFSPDWCLRAKAVTERLSRAVEQVTDTTYRLLQPKAELLGHAFAAEEWTVKLFSEEIVRGRPVFVMAMLLHQFDRVLRKGAKLGDWQVISPSRAAGVIKVVDELRSVQGRVFDQPTVVVADKVYGDEEPPEGVRAVLTSRSVDLVSHVAVRARNAGLLFATCFDAATFAELKRQEGQHIELTLTSAGDVKFATGGKATVVTRIARTAIPGAVGQAKAELRVLRQSEFERGLVGSKSWHIRAMAEKVGQASRLSSNTTAPSDEPQPGQRKPDALAVGFQTPRSVALPFGVFEAVLADPANGTVARRFHTLRQGLDAAPEGGLAQLRECIMQLHVPGKLMTDLAAAMHAEGFRVGQASRLSSNSPGRNEHRQAGQPNTPAAITRANSAPLPDVARGASKQAVPETPAATTGSLKTGGTPVLPALAAERIKQVWASLWNDRAYFSRQATGFPHDRASMAVLIQEVVPAEYAFVIHTVNPATGNRDELYAEVVRGLGETLVGNHPGRALSFTAAKATLETTVLAYPSKSMALFGGGLIFRSDSNAEDLEGYAGAGLYDSVLLDPAREERLDYTSDPLVWDMAFQHTLLRGISEVGVAVEKVFQSAQDIEGAWANGRLHVVQTRPQMGLAPDRRPG
jgi:alpha-glucan,water dikinase